MLKLTMVLGLLCMAGVAAPPSRGEEKAIADIVYVNNMTGSDDFSGRAAAPGAGKAGPYATIMRAVRQCAVGARIEIANTGVDYRETVSIGGFKKGRAATPLVIDGHGAYVTGLVVAPQEQWLHFKDDIYYFPNRVGDADFKPRGWYERKIGDSVYSIMPNSNWLGFTKHQGWFSAKEAPEAPEIFLLNGKPGPNVLKLEEIPPGGFFYDTQAETLKDLPGQRCLFFRPPAGKTMRDCAVELPLNQGIFVSDDYVTLCNIGSRYSQDDGFAGFWGQNVVLRNIHSCFNCDQGVSFHGNSSTLVDSAMIEHNGGCGVDDVMSCTTIYRNVTVRDNYPFGVLLQGFAHALYNCRIIGNHGRQVELSKGAAGSLVNCLIVGNGAQTGGSALSLEYGRVDHCTIVNSAVGISVAVGGSVRNSIVSDCQTALMVGKDALPRFSLDKTLLGLGEANLGGQKVNATGWAAFVKTFKGGEGAIVDTPKLEGPLFLL